MICSTSSTACRTSRPELVVDVSSRSRHRLRDGTSFRRHRDDVGCSLTNRHRSTTSDCRRHHQAAAAAAAPYRTGGRFASWWRREQGHWCTTSSDIDDRGMMSLQPHHQQHIFLGSRLTSVIISQLINKLESLHFSTCPCAQLFTLPSQFNFHSTEAATSSTHSPCWLSYIYCCRRRCSWTLTHHIDLETLPLGYGESAY